MRIHTCMRCGKKDTYDGFVSLKRRTENICWVCAMEIVEDWIVKEIRA